MVINHLLNGMILQVMAPLGQDRDKDKAKLGRGYWLMPGKQPLLFVNLTLNLKALKPAIQLPRKMVLS